MELFKIKSNYTHRQNPQFFDDSHNTDEWQYEVYQLAFTIAKIIPKLPILDIGCGSGYKLVHTFNDFDTIGIDLKETYDFLKKTYPNNKWEIKTEIPPSGKFGIVILSDVIEHLNNPNELLEYISNIDFKYLVISTPYRDSVNLSQDGPPKNLDHAREWTLQEFN